MGCITANKNIWYVPKKPKVIEVAFTKTNNGYFIKDNDATTLVDNIDEMKYYEKKLELLVKEIAKTYNIKLEEQKIE